MGYRPDPNNLRVHPERNKALIRQSLEEVGAFRSIAIDGDGVVRAGNGVYEQAQALGLRIREVEAAPDELIAVKRPDLVGDAARRAAYFDNASGDTSYFDAALLAAAVRETPQIVKGVLTDEELAGIISQYQAPPISTGAGDDPRPSLAERFGVPPFSVLDARQGYWQERKRAWIALGIQSELGRGDTEGNGSGMAMHDSNEFADTLARKRIYDAIPGGAGASSVYRDHGRRARTANDGMADSTDSLRIDDNRQSAKRPNAAPGGSLRPAASLGPDGKTRRGDGRGRGLARKNGQDLMRGEGTNVLPGKRQPETASLRDGLTWPTSIHPYDKTGEQRNSRAAADQRSNLNGSPTLPAWATRTGTENMASGTSIFDPVLCELVYRWFCPEGGAVLDPFAGGSVRGIIASLLGRAYTGIDLRLEQIQANEQQAAAITDGNAPAWVLGDSRDVVSLAPGSYDLIFSCPPYADLEVYSDDPRDLSTLEYQDFLSAYRAIIAASVGMLKPDRFAVFVVGDVRDKKGFYRNFVGATVDAFQDAGAILYNEAILVTAVGSLPIRIAKQFEGYRKLGKTHQNVLVFYKGDPKRIKDFGPVEMGSADEAGDSGGGDFGLDATAE